MPLGVNVGSVYGFFPGDYKILHEPILTYYLKELPAVQTCRQSTAMHLADAVSFWLCNLYTCRTGDNATQT